LHVAQIDREPQAGENLLERAVSTFERNFIHPGVGKVRAGTLLHSAYARIPLSTLKFKMDRLDIRELARKIRGG
jgi:hypothetical protein